ncbi:Sugar phosphate permease [Mesorhizobium albiziae]|uniref:Sugar phosphate permease n=1 Tax=Neomesorhizobium albiziae TaxID=335020 RepID=A0A1I4BY33_9HYPH|nr:MFS transporter [Mesorhizobium albiziae]GLS29624.1 MFS transporter [Mesorhizobium albiziae]SFK72906.1 Sugar phosphate permease [Mesorhizobium albiziae]
MNSAVASRIKVMLAATLGSTLEWYDFFIFAASTVLVFNKVFFPASDPFAATLLGLGTFAVGFLARPFGGIVFGIIGDRIGRKNTLIVSLLMMGAATVMIGLLPSYETIGIAAPLILLVIRVIQGIAVGGEATGALTIVAESMPAANRGFWTSFPMASGPAANVLALGVLALVQWQLGEEAFLAWGWRIPFLLSVVLIMLGFWARRQVDESPAFLAAKAENSAPHAPLKEALETQKASMTKVFFVKAAENTLLYLFSTFVLLLATTKLGLTQAQAIDVVWLASLISLPVILGSGWLSDRIGRQPVMITGFVVATIAAFVLFTLPEGAAPNAIRWRAIFALCAHGILLGGLASYVTEMFPTRVRYTALSASYQLASVLGGSIAPLVGALLVERTGTPVSVAIYAALMVVPALIVLALPSAKLDDEATSITVKPAPDRPSPSLR